MGSEQEVIDAVVRRTTIELAIAADEMRGGEPMSWGGTWFAANDAVTAAWASWRASYDPHEADRQMKAIIDKVVAEQEAEKKLKAQGLGLDTIAIPKELRHG
jgi:hypothetical protein